MNDLPCIVPSIFVFHSTGEFWFTYIGMKNAPVAYENLTLCANGYHLIILTYDLDLKIEILNTSCLFSNICPSNARWASPLSHYVLIIK